MMQPQSSPLPPIVLLVDRDPDSHELYETVLGLAGLWVAHSDSADDAVTYAAELRPDGIVIDMGLPTSVEGVALATQLRFNPRLADTPIVGLVSDVRRIEADSAVFSHVFSKPVPLDRFVRRLKWLTAQAAVMRQRNAGASARSPDSPAKSERLMEKGHQLTDAIAATPLEVRSCPHCRSQMQFRERRQLEGVLFDYYAPCPSGCGLYCYDHSRRKVVALIE